MTAPATRPASPHVQIREDWLASTQEAALDPDLLIVDAHHHLWDRPGERYLFPEFLADTNTGHRVVASVFVQCRSMYRAGSPETMRPVGEVEFANGVAAQSASGQYGPLRACAGIVGFADLRLGDAAEPVLHALLAAGGGRFRGVRNTTAAHPDPAIRSNPFPPPEGILLEENFRRGAALAGRMGLTLDVWAYHTQLVEVLDLARRCPDTVIMLDHVGGPLGIGLYAGRRDDVFRDWQAAMRDLSELPNIRVKLGGLAMKVNGFSFHEQARAPSSAALAAAWRPYIETAITLFGTKRCMFESNFPVDKGMCSYAVLWNAFKVLTASASMNEKVDLFHGTACDVYRLDITNNAVSSEMATPSMGLGQGA